jgi:uncharacterized protein YndB with AHSA1/START domain
VTDPLRISFEVSCAPEHAFAMWTTRIGAWWPADHTVSGQPARVVLEAGPGGRIYERTPEGVEHDWGTITDWDPPRRLGYSWHLMRPPSEATRVEIRFVAVDVARTRVDILHDGWDRLGARATDLRSRNRRGWQTLLPHFIDAIDHGDR